MKDKENENHESEKLENKRGLELGGSEGFSIFNDNYPFFLAYDLTRNLPEEPLPEEISNLFIINDIAQSNDNLIKWVTMPVIYIENKLHQIRNRMIKEYKILLWEYKF